MELGWRHRDNGPGSRERVLISTRAFVHLLFELGEVFQLDWREDGLVVDGFADGCRSRT